MGWELCWRAAAQKDAGPPHARSRITSTTSSYYNLGVAHGIPGAISMLGAAAALHGPEIAATRRACPRALRDRGPVAAFRTSQVQRCAAPDSISIWR
jgi:hypothetical protein